MSNDEALAYIERLKDEIEEKYKEINRVERESNMMPIDRTQFEKEASIKGITYMSIKVFRMLDR